VLQKEDNDRVKKCMEYEVEGARPRGRPKKTWREIVEKDCEAHKLNREHTIDRIRWMKQIRDPQVWPVMNLGETFVSCNKLASFIILCSIIWKCHVDKSTNNVMPLKRSNLLHYAVLVGKYECGL